MLRAALTLVALFGTAAPAAAGWFHPDSPLPLVDLRPIEDQLEILVRDRELLAIDAWSGGRTAVDLSRNEEILWSGVRGRVALVVTDRRAVATVPGAGWTERLFGVSESRPYKIVIGDRVAMLVTDRRVLGFEGVSGTWSESEIGRREELVSVGAGTNVAVAVTTRRALGVAAARGGLFQESLGLREAVDSLRVHGSFATVTTRLRVLTFRAPFGNWQSTDLRFR
jgi:hypothetical protein